MTSSPDDLPPGLSSMWRLCKLGYKHEPWLLVWAFVLALLAALPDALLALWLMLLGTGVIEQDRPVLAVARPKHSAGLLEKQTEGFGRPQHHRGADLRHVKPLADDVYGCQRVELALAQVSQQLLPMIRLRLAGQNGARAAGLGQRAGDHGGVRDGCTEDHRRRAAWDA